MLNREALYLVKGDEQQDWVINLNRCSRADPPEAWPVPIWNIRILCQSLNDNLKWVLLGPFSPLN